MSRELMLKSEQFLRSHERTSGENCCRSCRGKAIGLVHFIPAKQKPAGICERELDHVARSLHHLGDRACLLETLESTSKKEELLGNSSLQDTGPRSQQLLGCRFSPAFEGWREVLECSNFG